MCSGLRGLSEFTNKSVCSIKSIIKILLCSVDVRFPIASKCKKLCILGNGPSLNDAIDYIMPNRQHFDCMVVNAFCSDKRFKKIRPEFYVLIDPLYYIEINNEIGINAEYEAKKSRRDIMSLVECVCWDMILILPIEAKKNKELIEIISSNKNIKVLYINTIVFYGWNWLEKFFLKRKRCSFHFQNVLNAALYCGIEMQYRKIILFGADHDWFKNIELDKNRHILINDKHFYNESGEKRVMVNYDGSFFTMGQLFSAFAKTFDTYEKLANYAKQKQVEVYNGGSKSFIDSFPHIKDIN